jgi:hypothetical protein
VLRAESIDGGRIDKRSRCDNFGNQLCYCGYCSIDG